MISDEISPRTPTDTKTGFNSHPQHCARFSRVTITTMCDTQWEAAVLSEGI